MAHFTVIGLGRFGSVTAIELISLGHTVTGIDVDGKLIERYAESLTQAVICDATDEQALKELEVTHSEVVIVSIGTNVQASLLSVLALKNLGVKHIWVKSNTDAHKTLLAKLGVSKIIHPEEEMGFRVAHTLNYPMVEDYLSLGKGLYIVSLLISEKHQGVMLKSLIGLDLELASTLMVKRKGSVICPIESNFILSEHDKVVLCAHYQQLQVIANKFK